MNFNTERYRPGIERGSYTQTDTEEKVTHLWELGQNFMDYKFPMCRRGYNRENGQAYSIFRGHVSTKGICKICLTRASKNLSGVPPKGFNGSYEDWIKDETT